MSFQAVASRALDTKNLEREDSDCPEGITYGFAKRTKLPPQTMSKQGPGMQPRVVGWRSLLLPPFLTPQAVGSPSLENTPFPCLIE